MKVFKGKWLRGKWLRGKWLEGKGGKVVGEGIVVKKERGVVYRRWFVGFFVVMVVLTVLSRVIDSVIVPKVSVGGVLAGNLSYVVSGEGVVEAADRGFVEIPAGVRVDGVVAAGTKVDVGQGVVFLRVAYLEDRLGELERDLEKLQLSLERERLSGKAAARTGELEAAAGDRAATQKELADAQLKLQVEQEEYTKALEVLKKNRERDRGFEERRFSLSKEEVDKVNQVSGNQVKQNYSQAQLDYSMAVAAIDDVYEAEVNGLMDKLKAAVELVDDRQDAFDRVEFQAGIAAKNDENYQKNSSTAVQISGKTQDIMGVDLEEKKKEIAEVEALIQAGGVVKASIGGVVTEMGVSPGSVTGQDEVVEVGSGKFLFRGSLEREDMGILAEGDAVEVSMPMLANGAKGKIINIGVKIGMEVGQKDGNDGGEAAYGEFTAELEEGDYRIGSAGSFMVKKSSQMKYDTMIPIEAVRQDGGGKFCLIVEKKVTILGEEDIAVRVNIELLKTDEMYGAVNGSVGSEDLIITGSNKAIKEGDRVRVQ